MPILWPFCPSPEWTEALEWVSEVIPTYSAEQRIAKRAAPIQTLSYEHTMTFRQWEMAKLLVSGAGNGNWYVPLWHERQRVTVSSGAGSVSIDTTSSDYRDDGYALLWTSEEVCEVIPLDGVTSNAISIDGVTSRAYHEAFCMPVRIGICPDGIEGGRQAGPIVPVSIEFVIYDDEDLSENNYPTYRSYPTIPDCPTVGGGSFNEQLTREVESVDNGIATPFLDTVSDRVSHLLALAWMPDNLSDLSEIRRFLHSCYGQQKAFWVPDWTRGLELTQSIASGNTSIRIRAVGLNNNQETGDLFLKTESGTISRHRFTSVTTSGTDEILNLSGTAGANVSIGQERTFCLMRLCRLVQNRVEFSHTYRGQDRNLSSVIVRCTEVPYA